MRPVCLPTKYTDKWVASHEDALSLRTSAWEANKWDVPWDNTREHRISILKLNKWDIRAVAVDVGTVGCITAHCTNGCSFCGMI